MSYILDALRRADAERDRGAVPGIHAQQVPVQASASTGTAPWVWMAGGAVLLLVGIAAWRVVGEEDTPPVVVAAAPPPVPTHPQPLPPPRSALPVTLPPIVADPAPPRPAPPPRAEATRPPAAASANEVRIPSLQELPEPVRRQIPAMSIGGSIYSDKAASRFLIINGQVFHEGNRITPDLVLEQIKLKAAVLRFKDQRFAITF